MKKSRILTLLLVAVLTLSLAGTVFAETGDQTVTTPTKTTIDVSSTIQLPTFKVTIAAPTNVILNPYKMDVTIGSDTKDDTVFSHPCLITNESDVDMKITAAPTATPSSDVKLITEKPDSDTIIKDKSVYLVMHMANAANSTVSSYDGTAPTGGDFSNTVHTVFTKTANPDPCSITLAKQKNADSTTTPKYGVYLIKGDSLGSGWDSTTDSVSLSLVFDIQPASLSAGT